MQVTDVSVNVLELEEPEPTAEIDVSGNSTDTDTDTSTPLPVAETTAVDVSGIETMIHEEYEEQQQYHIVICVLLGLLIGITWFKGFFSWRIKE